MEVVYIVTYHDCGEGHHTSRDGNYIIGVYSSREKAYETIRLIEDKDEEISYHVHSFTVN